MKNRSKEKRIIEAGPGKHLLKVIALITAIFMWYYVLSTEPLEVTREVALQIDTPLKQSVATSLERKVMVSLRGPRAFIRGLENKSMEYFLDLKKMTPIRNNFYRVDLSKTQLSLPLGVKVIKVVPQQLIIRLEPSQVKDVVVLPNLQGELESQLRLISQKIKPKKVKVEGPRSMIRQLDNLYTAPIDLKQLQNSGSLSVKLGELDPRLKVLGPSDFLFEFVVRPTKANLRLKNIAIRFLSSRQVSKSSHRKVNLLVLSEKGDEAEIERKDISVVADIPDSARGWTKVKLRAELPTEIHLLKIEPESVNVFVK